MKSSMYIKFLAHGKGDPSKASSYLIDEVDHLNRPRPDIQVLRGDPQTFTALAQSIQNDWIYTSGVIAWSKSDNPTDAEVSEVLDEFEKHAFAGLQPNQYHFTAVLHEEDDGSKHVHFLVPRIELETKKALNIAPPGHEKYFDPLRDYFNYSKGWSRPDDPALQSDTQTPDHVHFQDKSAVRAGLKNKTVKDIREIVGSYIEQRVEHGFIRDRKDVLDAVSELGTVTRTNDKFISLKIDGAEKAIRLKGAFYESEFSIESYFENRTREADDVSTPSGHRIISAEHKRLALENSERVQGLSARRSKYNADRYFSLGTDTAEFRLDRDREPESTQHIERTSTAEPSITTTGTTVNHFNAGQQHTAERADQAHQIHADSGNFSINPFAFSSSGEVNERIKNLDEPTSRLVEESNRRTEQITETVREVHEAINRTKRAFDSREPNQIRVNFDAERADSKHQIEETIGRFFTDVRIQHESAFTNAVKESARSIEPTAYGQSSYSEQNQSIAATVTARSYAIDEAAFSNFYADYSDFKRSESKRSQQQVAEVRTFSQQLDRTTKHIDLIARQLSNIVIKPKPCTDLTRYFKNNGYRSPTAERIQVWSERQHEAFKNRNIEQVAYYIETKYQELGHYKHYEKGLSRDEINIVNSMLRNDERIIDYMKNSGCHLNYDTRQKLNRTYSLERTSNENRLNHLDKQENTVKPLFQPKAETKAIELNNDNGFTM